LRSIDTGVLSVSEAMGRLGVAIANETLTSAQANRALAEAVVAAAAANAQAAENAASIARANAATWRLPMPQWLPPPALHQSQAPLKNNHCPLPEAVTTWWQCLPSNWFTDYSAAQKIAFFNEKGHHRGADRVREERGTSEAEIREQLDWILANGYRGFAAGGLHTGGLRLVGERGPELEVTGPARYWSFEQTNAMLSGGTMQERRNACGA
jgi:hypothetical protein